MDYLVDWASRHRALLPNLAAWGREWSDDYPRFSDIMAEHKQLHDKMVSDACRKEKQSRFCDRILAAVRVSAVAFRKADGLTLQVVRSFAEWWNKLHADSPLVGQTKKAAAAAECRCTGSRRR